MKKSKTTTENPVPTVKTELPVATKTSKTAPKKISSNPPPQKQAEAVAPKPKAEQPILTVATEAKQNKTNPEPLPKKKAQPVTAKPAVATPELTVSERVGLTAGSIWHYLSENGATPVTKLVAALTEEEKIIHRGIGWLAQEDKISINTVDRIETIALKA